MYRAKRSGANHNESRQVINIRSNSVGLRDRFGDEIRAALAANELDVFYQPIVRNSDRLVTGVEALLRWTHPERGAVPPMAIVAIAEQRGLIDDIGTWVLERACTDRWKWLDQSPLTVLDLAVNVSARQLLHLGFGHTVADVIARTGMDPTALILEVTENVFVEHSDRVLTVLGGLRSTGIRIAIDDFGTGYSSLGYLTRLPIDIVKIDRCFVTDTNTGPGITVAAAITHLAHDLGLAVIAEGVETQAQHHIVTTIGCDSAQGYFYAHPMPASAVRDHRSWSLLPRGLSNELPTVRA
jgi:EAL domain-containing protein (putative c-di-GMP-specific phosphodiesterase class I)